jgi:hypothetical protein
MAIDLTKRSETSSPLTTPQVDGNWTAIENAFNSGIGNIQVAEMACSGPDTLLTTGTEVAWWYAERAGTMTAVSAGVRVVATGAAVTADINKNGTTILSTKITIDVSEYTSLTAATPAVISVASFAAGDRFTVDIDQVGSTIAGKELLVKMFYTYTS